MLFRQSKFARFGETKTRSMRSSTISASSLLESRSRLMSILDSDRHIISNTSAGRSNNVLLLLQLRPSPLAKVSGKSSPNIASKKLIDGALNVVDTLLRRLTTPARAARLGLRRGDSGSAWSVLATLGV